MDALADLFERELHASGALAHPPPLPPAALSRIAHALLFDYVLVAGDRHWRLTEFEFYIHHPDQHPDPFCHRDPSMVAPAQWYVHKSGGSRKGVDVTCGVAGVHGGILIRGLDHTRGPSKCTDLIMAALGVTSARDLAARAAEFALVPRQGEPAPAGEEQPGGTMQGEGPRNGVNETIPPHLLPLTIREPVFVSPRVGLAPTTSPRAGRGHRPAMPDFHTQLTYVFAPYRYLIEPWRSPQKHMAAMGRFERAPAALSLRALQSELQLTTTTVRAWDAERVAGRGVADPKALAAKLGSSSAAAWMRLFGWYQANQDRWVDMSVGGGDGVHVQQESDLSDLDG